MGSDSIVNDPTDDNPPAPTPENDNPLEPSPVTDNGTRDQPVNSPNIGDFDDPENLPEGWDWRTSKGAAPDRVSVIERKHGFSV